MNTTAKRGSLRVIAGQWRRRRIVVPEGGKTRPTSERARETLFNWLVRDIVDARCCDLFAGSGALAIEALSRGATSAIALDNDRNAIAAIEKSKASIGADALITRRVDAARFIADQHAPAFDIAFWDPPFTDLRWARLLPQLTRIVVKDGLVYCESPAARPAPEHPFHRLKSVRIGASRIELLQVVDEVV